MSCARFTSVVALALVATNTLADDSVRTETFTGKEAAFELQRLLAPAYAPIPSVRMERCISRWLTLKATHPRRYQLTEGCALTIAAVDFPKLAAKLGHLATNSVEASTPVPAVGTPFDISEVYFMSPPEAWRINDPLIYTNGSHTRVLVYAHFLVEE